MTDSPRSPCPCCGAARINQAHSPILPSAPSPSSPATEQLPLSPDMVLTAAREVELHLHSLNKPYSAGVVHDCILTIENLLSRPSAGSRDALELVRKIKSLGFVGSDDLTDQEMQLVVTALERFGATAQRPSDAFIQGIREALIEKCVRVVEGTGAAMFSDGEAEAVDALRSDIAAGIRALALPSTDRGAD